jgi:hypothetical protein
VLDMRELTVKEGKQPEFCNEILENFRNFGTPVGELKKNKKYKPYFG